jgi:DNA uptake protein ComE-like DNA-binding protein
VSRTGAVVETDTWYLHQSERFAAALVRLVARHGASSSPSATAPRRARPSSSLREALASPAARDALAAGGVRPQVVVVNESGASVYSASDLAREELPDLDVSLRGAVSIARRLQDPLAELVKIDPKSIGVGQYQHDVNQPQLKRRLDEVVESCVNRVGVEVNTASAALLAYVAGVGPSLAQNIVRRATRAAASARAASCSRCRGSAPRRSSRRPASSACAAAPPARRERGAPRALRARRAHGGRPRRGARRARGLEERRRASSRALRERRGGAADAARHPRRAAQAGARPARGVRAAGVPRRREGAQGPRARGWCSRAW